ncbi:MAG: ubiquinol-cytochrome C chaperone family protein [Beijerinckiaceae bacterium]
MVFGLFSRKKAEPSVERLYGDIVAASRTPALYRDCGVPDTVMGRFESLGLHVVLVLRRLRELPAPADSLAQDLVDRFFLDLDGSLRQIGIGDVSVPKKIKKLGQAFYGRADAYNNALDETAAADALEMALARNVLEKADQPGLATALAQYTRHQVAHLSNHDLTDILSGRLFLTQDHAG